MLSVYDPTSKQRFEEQVKAIGNGEQSNLLYKKMDRELPRNRR